ncbi:NAD(P)-dependent oxidoreductase [Paramicrobacterium chengjingii]|uniref:NAD(P)-dependent oxidoreductase n=1 Tax=Paramicrobacterium chengjingii TaxID=2769067 RepID=UPI00141F9C05|nr:NAD(P)-dependent oxidoreductase [Microbacterium chengjingii]
MKCAVIGLGEVGSRYARALRDADHDVIGFDPAVSTSSDGLTIASTLGDAVDGTEMVLIMTGASAAPRIAADAAPRLSPGCIYADFTSASPKVMSEVGDIVAATGARFCDVAVLGPVSVHGPSVPVMLAGPGAEAVATVLLDFGGEVEVLEDAQPGEAMAHKLLRSIFMKGLASIICEAVDASEAAGLTKWTRQQIANQLAGDGQAVIDRFLVGSRTHAVRRAQEMRDTATYLNDLGVPNTMSAASAQYLGDLSQRVVRHE